jgi:23S rRNA-/tRNA-specific pseudouridylate synthase
VRGEVALLGEADGIVGVCKPSSMPMHPCGGYRYNSLYFILTKVYTARTPREDCTYALQELGLRGLHLVHRLDRVTSGVVILARTKEKAHTVAKNMEHRHTEKVCSSCIRA